MLPFTVRFDSSDPRGLVSSRVRPEMWDAPDTSIEALVGSRIVPQADGCWIWTGEARAGYGQIKVGGRRTQAHRFVYVTLVGPIQRGCHLHHICDNRRCCNPEHLVALSPLEHHATHANLRHGGTSVQRFDEYDGDAA